MGMKSAYSCMPGSGPEAGPGRNARPAWRRIVRTWALSLVLLAAGAAAGEAAMIPAGVRLPYLDSRDFYLFQLALPLENLEPDICGQRSRRSSAEVARNGPGEVVPAATAPLAGRLIEASSGTSSAVPPGNIPRLNKLAWDLNALGPDVHWTNGTLVSLLLIKARLTNIESCIVYLQNLLRMIDQVNSEARLRATATAYDGSVQLYRTFFVAKAQGRTGAQGSGSQGYSSQATGSLPAAPSYRAESQLSGTHSAMLNVSRSRINEQSAEKSKAPDKEQRATGRVSWTRITIKEFIFEVFSQVYTYILIFVISIMALFMKYRV